MGRGRDRQIPKEAKALRCGIRRAGSKMRMLMGWARSWEKSSPQAQGVQAGCAALCPPSLSWPLSSGVLRQRPYVNTWVELEAGAARSVVTGRSLWAALYLGCSHLSLLPQSWGLNVSVEPSTALSLRPHRAE